VVQAAAPVATKGKTSI